jgi:hypothetical protein
MTDDRSALSHHPAPSAGELSSAQAAFLLFTGPIAWFVQLCVGSMLTSWPCFPGMERLSAPLAGYAWAHAAAVVVLLLAAALAAVSSLAAWRKFQAVRGEREGGHAELVSIGHGRTRFVALWGMILGAGFSLSILVNLVGFAMVPLCLG